MMMDIVSGPSSSYLHAQKRIYRPMKQLIGIPVICVALFSISGSSTAQSSLLCRGHYYTEAQGAAKLRALQKRLHTLADWEQHADSMRAQVRKGMELEVFPKKNPLNPHYRHKKVMDGYTVESVVFESLPGFYVTGNLYRPTGKFPKKSLAVVLQPHGHFSKEDDYGRFMRDVQYGSAAIARMGALVFAYDMVGWGESTQLDHDYEKVLAFQTWNSIRVIDFLLTLPEADPQRIAVTGASGGGTQTFMLTALDNRVALSIPVVMVSANFFGGCSCESGMPVHRRGNTVFSNAEIACLAAPRPMLLISDGKDWTKNNETVEYPFAQHVYALYNNAKAVENAHFPDEGHDYGRNKRHAAYLFLARHFDLDLAKISDTQGNISENFVTILPRKDLEYFAPEEKTGLIKGEEVYHVFLASRQRK